MTDTLTPTKPRTHSDNAKWREYERRKAALLRSNKVFTREEYERAIRKIAQEIGI